MTPATASPQTESAGKRSNDDPAVILRSRIVWYFVVASLLLATVGIGMTYQLAGYLSSLPVTSMTVTGTMLWSAILFFCWRGLPWHLHPVFGPANIVTLFRSAGTVLIACLIPVAALLPTQWQWVVTALAILLLSLDGIDGYLARRTGLESLFGARFDMEIDALLILTISVFLWQSGEIGIWITALGLMRYAFVLASIWYRPLQGELYDSFRRKLICVIQLVALCAILSPLISSPMSSVVGVIALICLAGSFAHDILWLQRHQPRAGASAAHKAPGTVANNDTSP